MNSDLGHNEVQFQLLRYQLDSRVKLLVTLVAKWLERWQTCSASLRTAIMFCQKLESDHGWIAICTNEWCYMYTQYIQKKSSSNLYIVQIALTPLPLIFIESAPLGRFRHRVAMSVYLSLVCAIGYIFFLQSLSLALLKRHYPSLVISHLTPVMCPVLPSPAMKVPVNWWCCWGGFCDI